jgi:hypothetical protein
VHCHSKVWTHVKHLTAVTAASNWQSTVDWPCTTMSCTFIFAGDGTLNFVIISRSINIIRVVSWPESTDRVVSPCLWKSRGDTRSHCGGRGSQVCHLSP